MEVKVKNVRFVGNDFSFAVHELFWCGIGAQPKVIIATNEKNTKPKMKIWREMYQLFLISLRLSSRRDCEKPLSMKRDMRMSQTIRMSQIRLGKLYSSRVLRTQRCKNKDDSRQKGSQENVPKIKPPFFL